MTTDEFIAWLAPTAQKICRQYELPASVCVAQGALESAWGKAVIGEYNLFGRKWNGSGPFVEKETEEYYNGEWQSVIAKFQDYASLEEAVADWCILITEEPVYAPCLECRHEVTAFVQTLGPIYATDPDYATKILATIAANQLTDYDE